MSPIVLEVPEGTRSFNRLVLDFTGTLSLDGLLLPGVEERLRRLADVMEVTVLTADTFGSAQSALGEMPMEVQIIEDGKEKAEVVRGLGPEGVIAVGNGRNDIPMMEVAALGLAIMGPEGAAAALLASADIVCRDINDALDLLLHPLRAKATLRE